MIATPLPSGITPEIADGLTNIVGDKYLLKSDYDRIAYSRDCYPKMLIWSRSAKFPHLPGAICLPADQSEVQKVLAFLAKKAVPVIPYGGGSGVAGGTLPIKGGVIVDVKRINSASEIDEYNQTIEVGAGMMGEHFEHYLNRFGYTLGHFPSSIMCSTVGGWLAARSAGQLSSRFGKIEDMVLSIRLITPTGKKMEFNRSPRTAFDNSFAPLLMGGEGTTGIITSAIFRVHRLAPAKLYRGFRFKNVAHAANAMRAILQAGLSPACLRLYDELDTIIALDKGGSGSQKGIMRLPVIKDIKEFFSSVKEDHKKFVNSAMKKALKSPKLLNAAADRLPTGCLLIIGYEGEEKLCAAAEKQSLNIFEELGGTDLGRDPGEKWLRTRYNISFKMPPMFLAGAFADTMEVATDWNNLMPLYRTVKRALSPLAFIMAHFSHAYADGCSIYFTFAAAEESDPLSAAKYDKIWNVALEAVHSVGATISHHHGIGYSKQSYLFQEFGSLMEVHKALKETLDPSGFFNPDKLAFGERSEIAKKKEEENG